LTLTGLKNQSVGAIGAAIALILVTVAAAAMWVPATPAVDGFSFML